VIVPFGAVSIEIEAALPSSRDVPTIVLAHPHPRMGGTMQNKVIDQLFRRSKDRGWGAVRFNSRGTGQSTGSYDRGNSETEDVQSVLQWAAESFERPTERITLVGYSFGSWVCTQEAAHGLAIEKLVLIAPPLGTMNFNAAYSISLPKVVFLATKDEFCPMEVAQEWFRKLQPPKALHIIQGADHFFAAHTTRLVREVLNVVGG
jgi:alpha/beta superfamily hydrolase